MSEETKTSDMLRYTAKNLSELLIKMADHIDMLESKIKELQEKINVDQ